MQILGKKTYYIKHIQSQAEAQNACEMAILKSGSDPTRAEAKRSN